jgi:hypothetical protein
MRLFPSLCLLLSLAFAGCESGRNPSVWNTVRTSRIDARNAANPSDEYARHLAGVLRASHVDCKVVAYEYRYRTYAGDEAIATRTAVIYRQGDGRDPWWLMEDRLRTPVWVPGDDLEHQISFYLHRQATIVSVNGHALGDGKRQVELQATPARLPAIRTTERSRKYVPVAHNSRSPQIGSKDLARFRAIHGTAFNPASIADRLKMERLRVPHRATVALR